MLYNAFYDFARTRSFWFVKAYKRLYYAELYGAKHYKILDDVIKMYNMGGEI